MLGTKPKEITVLGTGSWGTTIAILLTKNGHKVRLWGIEASELKDLKENHASRYLLNINIPNNINIFSDLAKALHEVKDLIVAVPSHAFRSLLLSIKPYFTKDMRLAWVSKGLDDKRRLLHEAAQEILGEIPLAVLSGPSFAAEVAKGLPTAVTIASNQKTFAEDLASYFHNEAFRIYTSEDIIGVEIGGAVKNVLAIGIGIADGMQFGASARAALITRGLTEIIRLGTALGGQLETFIGLSGLGDLILTCTDDLSRNRRFGLSIGKGLNAKQAEENIGQVVEGIANAKAVYLLAKSKNIEMPIVEQVYKILYENLPPKEAVTSLLQRARKQEVGRLN